MPEKIVLKNGLVVFLLPNPMIPQVRATAMIHAGSLREEPEESGLASLTASVMRLGGSTITSATEMNRKLEFAGASLECSAIRDFAGISLKALSKDRDLAFGLMAEMLLAPAFPQEKIDQRRAEMVDSLRRQEDDPTEITRREFRKLLFGNHPYGRDPLGTEATLASFSRDDLVRWHSKWFKPNRILLSVSGDFSRDEMVTLLEKLFGSWDAAKENPDYPPVSQTSNLGKRFFVAKDLNQSTVRIGHLGIARNDPDRIPVDVLNFIVGSGGFSSRLFNRVRNESGFAYSALSEFEDALLQGQFLAFLQTQTANTAKATELALQIIREVAETANITEEELNLAKQSKLNDFVFKFETPSDSCLLRAQLEFYGMPADYWETYRERLAAVTLEDVKRVARKYLRPEQLTILILGSEEVPPLLKDLGEFSEIKTLPETLR
jgi:predicted Zn-dependent peptidase